MDVKVITNTAYSVKPKYNCYVYKKTHKINSNNFVPLLSGTESSEHHHN